jgi:hypothetical protein
MSQQKYNHEEYMEDIATSLKLISHSSTNPRFFKSVGLASMDGLLNNVSRANYPCIVAERGPDKRLIDNTSDNLIFQPYFTFFVLYAAEPGNDESIRTARDNAEHVANLILGRMLNFRSTDDHEGLEMLDENSIRVLGVGPLADFAHGVMVTFTIKEAAELYYDDDDWQ